MPSRTASALALTAALLAPCANQHPTRTGQALAQMADDLAAQVSAAAVPAAGR